MHLGNRPAAGRKPDTGGTPASDMLSMLMGTQEFLLALVDYPDWIAEAIGRWRFSAG